MSKMIEISMIVPKRVKILIPEKLFEEFEDAVKEEDLSKIVAEALAEELKKVRFRNQLEKASSKVA